MSNKNDDFEDFLLFQMVTKKGGGGGCLTLTLSIIGIITLLLSIII